MENNKQVDLNSWQQYAGEYLKTDIVSEFPLVVVPKEILGWMDSNDKPRLAIVIEYMKKDWKIELNKTNQMFIRNNKIKSPKDLVGKKLTFDKVKVRNPQLNTMVDSLLLTKIQ